MITIKTFAVVNNRKATDIIDFFVNCTDERYQNWWKEAHLKFHTIKGTKEVIGNVVYFDEYVGKTRLKFRSIITDYNPHSAIEYQMIKLIKLPAYLRLDFIQEGNNVKVIHTLKLGFSGYFSFLDSIIKPFIPKSFVADLDKHAETEFGLLSE